MFHYKIDSSGSADNPIRYAGYQYDEETGLYYLNARMYDPTIARFLQEDTYTGDNNDPLSLNLYAYCNNNPLIYNDPTGHWPQFLDDAAKAVGDFVDEAKTAVSEAWNGVKSAATGAWDEFKKYGSVSHAVNTFVLEASQPVSKAWDGFKSKASATWEGAKKTNPLSTAAIESVSKFVMGIIEIPKIAVNEISEFIANPLEKIKQNMAMVGLITGNRALCPEKQDAIVNGLIEGIKTSFNDNIINGDTHTRAEAVFDTVLFVGSFFIGTGEVKTASTVAKVEEGVNAASKVEQGLNVTAKAEEGLNAFSKAESALSQGGRSPYDILKQNGVPSTLDDLTRESCDFFNYSMKYQEMAEAGKLKSVGNGVWESTEGLIYGQGSKQGNRVLHVLEHASPDPTKPLHSVFNVSKDKVLGVVDEAWSMRSGITPILQKNGNQVFNIPMGRVVGTNGETSIRIVVKNGTSEVVTGFPVK